MRAHYCLLTPMFWGFDCFQWVFAKSPHVLAADQKNPNITNGLPESIEFVRGCTTIWINRPIEKFVYLMAEDGLAKVYLIEQRRWLKRVSSLT